MKNPQKITICGFGGQGIILAAVILGTTAVTKEKKYALQTQSYGSEARGGECQAELIIDDEPILSPVAEKKNLLIAMSQSAYDKYIGTLEKEGVLVYDSSLVNNLQGAPEKSYGVPFTRIAADLGNRMAANVAMLGFLGGKLGLVDLKELEDVVKDNVPARFLELNLEALKKGAAYSSEEGHHEPV